MDKQNLAERLDATPLYEGCGDASDLPERAAAELRRMQGEIERLSKIECEWAALSQDDGKAHREIERERESRQAAQIENEALKAECLRLQTTLAQAEGLSRRMKPVLSAAVALVCAPAWAGVGDEDVALEQALRDAGMVLPSNGWPDTDTDAERSAEG